MIRFLLTVAVLPVVVACASTTLPYKPERQPAGANISAAYQLVGDQLRIEVDTDHRRLEEALIVKADGTAVRAQTLEIAPSVSTSSPVGVGIGVGGGTFGRGVGVGTGVGVGVPIGGGTTVSEGNTFATFPVAQTGPPPWRLHLKLAGVEPVEIFVGAPPGSR
jgi:hypothetical protein